MESGGTYWHTTYFFDLIYKGHLSSSVPVIFFKKLPIIILEGCTISYAMDRHLSCFQLFTTVRTMLQ